MACRADSAVTTLNLAIPGKRQVLTDVDPGGSEVILPKGEKALPKRIEVKLA